MSKGMAAVLAAHTATAASISRGGMRERGGHARRCTCKAEIWVFFDELPDSVNSTDALLNERFGQHVAEQLDAAGYGNRHDAWQDGFCQAQDDHDCNGRSASTPNPYPQPEE